MSLINDALKRANEVKPPAPESTEAAPPLRPAEHKSRPAWPAIVFPLLALFVFALAGWFLVKGVRAGRDLRSTQIKVFARENPAAESSSKSALTNATPIADKVVAAQATNLEPVTVEPAPAPTFKLQGIFYRLSRPSAMINSRTVFVGDKVGEAKVLAIGRESVTLDCQGETKVLTLQ